MRVRWTINAVRARRDIFEYIAEEDEQAAIAVDVSFEHVADLLSKFPTAGKAGVVSGTREILPTTNYRLVYEILDDTIYVLTIIHARRRWPE